MTERVLHNASAEGPARCCMAVAANKPVTQGFWGLGFRTSVAVWPFLHTSPKTRVVLRGVCEGRFRFAKESCRPHHGSKHDLEPYSPGLGLKVQGLFGVFLSTIWMGRAGPNAKILLQFGQHGWANLSLVHGLGP